MCNEEKKEVENISSRVSKVVLNKNETDTTLNQKLDSVSTSSFMTEEKSTIEKLHIPTNEVSCSSSVNKKSSVKKNEFCKEKQTVEFLLNEFCDELDHQLLGITSSMQHHVRVQSRLERKLKRHSEELVLLNGKALEMRQKITYMQRVRAKSMSKSSHANNENKDKVEKQSIPLIRIRKHALEHLMVKVNDRLKLVKTVSNQDVKKSTLVLKAKESASGTKKASTTKQKA